MGRGNGAVSGGEGGKLRIDYGAGSVEQLVEGRVVSKRREGGREVGKCLGVALLIQDGDFNSCRQGWGRFEDGFQCSGVKLGLFVTAPPPPPGEFVVSPLDPSSERGPCAPPRGPFLKICFFRYTRLHTSRVRALETASFTLEGAAATCEEITMDETMVVLLTHDARQVERALRRALHCPQQHSKLPAPHLLALVP